MHLQFTIKIYSLKIFEDLHLDFTRLRIMFKTNIDFNYTMILDEQAELIMECLIC